MEFWILVWWILQGMLTGWVAEQRRRGPMQWFFVAMAMGPLALIAVGLTPIGPEKKEK